MKGNRLRVECETDAKCHFFSFPFMCSAKIHHWRWFHPWMLYSNFIVKSTMLNFISACSLISSSTILLQNKSQTIHRHEIVNGNNGLTKQRLDASKAPLKIFYAELYSLLTLFFHVLAICSCGLEADKYYSMITPYVYTNYGPVSLTCIHFTLLQ